MRKLFFSLALGTCLTPSMAQEYKFLNEDKASYNIFNHLDASITLGTTGIGIDVATPVSNWTQLRVGYSFMPRFNYNVPFEIQVGDEKESKYDAQGKRVETKFDRLATMLEDITGYEVDDEVWMTGRPTYHNLKVLVDVFPFQSDKRWHVTAGFFWGPSRIADAVNKTEEMPSLLAVGIYNRLYERTMASYAKGFPYDPIISVGGFEIDGKQEVEAMYKRLSQYGRMGMRVGTKNDGTPYVMEPGTDGMVRAEVRVNSFKPYIGVGYGGRLVKGSDRLHIGIDLGAMYWGRPSIIIHDGTDLVNDIQKGSIDGKPGDYVKLVRSFHFLPVLDVRLVYSIF